MASLKGPTTPIPDDVLRENGLESLWYFPPDTDANPVTLASLAPEGLLVSTQPTPMRRGHLRKMRRDSGETVWTYEFEEGQPLNVPPQSYTYPKGSEKNTNELYFSQLDTMYVLDLRWGDLLYKQQLKFPVSSGITATEDFIFVGSDNGRCYSLSKERKVEEWSHRTGAGIVGVPAVGATGVVFVSRDGAAYRFSPVAGWVRGFSWKLQTGAELVSEPVVYANKVLVGSTDYKLYCLEEIDGSVSWSFLAEAPIETPPVVYAHRPGEAFAFCVAVERSKSSTQRTLFAVNMRDGSRLWRQPGMRQVVSIGRENLYVLVDPDSGGDRSLAALDLMTGKEKFRIDVGQFNFAPTNSADFGRDKKERGRIYLVAEDGAVQVIGERY